MTARGFYTLLFGALMLFTALSVGSAGAFLLGTAALLCWALSLLCVCAAALSCRAEQQLEGGQTQRGGTCRLILRVRFALPAPIAPLSLRVELPSGRQSDFSLSAGLLGLIIGAVRFADSRPQLDHRVRTEHALVDSDGFGGAHRHVVFVGTGFGQNATIIQHVRCDGVPARIIR